MGCKMSTPSVMLPERFLVKGFKHCSRELVPVYMLLHAGCVFHPTPTTQMVEVLENPLSSLENGVWKEDRLELDPFQVQLKVINQSSVRNIQMIRTKEILQLTSGRKLSVYTMSHMMDVLHPWSCIYRGWDTSNRWAFSKEDVHPLRLAPRPLVTPLPFATPILASSWVPQRRQSPPPQPTSVAPAIPKHILQVFVDAAIAKEETCPITLDPLTRATAACLPCGHLVDHESLKRAVQERKCCPVCRTPGTIDQIQGQLFGN